MSMEFSDRDKTLLYIVASIVILGAAYFFGYKNFSEKKTAFKAETQTYNDEYASLIELQKNKSMYLTMTDEYAAAREQILGEYENGYSQSNMMDTFIDMETATGIWLSEVSYSLPETVYTFTSEQDLFGVRNVASLAFEGNYSEVKLLLASILNINSKTAINSFTVEYDEANQLCTGKAVISHYSVASSTTEEPQVEYNIPTGVSNIFDSAAVTSNTQTQAVNANYILTDYDICIIINPDESTFDSVIVGTTNDAKAKDTITSDENNTVDVTVTVDGSDGKYKISYKVGDKKYPSKNYESGTNFDPGETLDLLVESSVRDGDKDKVAVKANLINHSDLPLNVLVHGDDTVSPRFTATSREGEITIYR